MAIIAEIEFGTDAWYDFVQAAESAKLIGRKVSVSIDQNGRGEDMMAFRVGGDVWSAHRPTRLSLSGKAGN